MKRILLVFFVLWLSLIFAKYAFGDVSAKVTFTLGTVGPLKVEVLRDATVIDVTTSYFTCGASSCAIVSQPIVAGTFLYSIRVTDSLGVVRSSNQIPLVIPNSVVPACQQVQVVVTTGTPTQAVSTPTP